MAGIPPPAGKRGAGSVSLVDCALRRRIYGQFSGKNSAVEMVPTPDKNLVVIAFFGKIIGFLRIKPCSLFALEFAQKNHDLHFFCETRGQPAPAMDEF